MKYLVNDTNEKRAKANADRAKEEEEYITNDEHELVARFNSRAAVVVKGGKVFIMVNAGGRMLFLSQAEAKLMLAPYKLLVDPGDPQKPVKFLDGFPVWMKHPLRKTYNNVVFSPPPEYPSHDEFNLWEGWSARARKGDCSIYMDHVRNNICRGDDKAFRFFMGWQAQLIQEPGIKSGVCVVIRGAMGTGKSVVSNYLGQIVGDEYSPIIDTPGLLTGRFNGQLETALLVRVEEGFFADDPSSHSRLKHLITSSDIMIERKNMQPYMAKNYARVLMTTNSEKAVPAGAGERRMFVLECGDARKQDRQYFSAMAKQMEDGGLDALFYVLKHWDYSDIDFTRPLVTSGLVDQVRRSFTPEEKWLETVLTEGRFPFLKEAPTSQYALEWTDEGQLIIEKDLVLASYRDFVPGFRSPPSAQQLGSFIAKQLPGVQSRRHGSDGDRIRVFVFPPLRELRASFETARPGYKFAHDDDRSAGAAVVPFRRLSQRL